MWQSIVGAAAGGMSYVSPSKNLQNVFDGYTFDRWAKADENWENQKVADKYMDKQNSWNERMANSAHQREVQDLVNAGLNPILSSGGKGADSPTSAGPTNMGMKGMSPALHFPGVQASPAMATIMQQQQQVDNNSAKTVAEIEKIKAETPGVKARTNLTKAQALATGKGAVRAELEKGLAGSLKDAAEWLKDKWNNPEPGSLKYKIEQMRKP